MLAQILEDMWVEPEVLEALSEEQRRILFLKMREEQVRRWKEREEKEEREGRANNSHSRPKKASSKHVSWLLGRDGDVSVSVIGEVDEFRSSKLLKSLLTNTRLHSDSMNGIQTVSLLSEGEAHQHESKQEIQLLLDKNASVAPHDASSEEEVDSGSTEGDPRDPEEDSDSESGSTTANNTTTTTTNSPKGCAPLYRPHYGSHGNRLPPKAQPSVTEKPRPQDRVAVRRQEEKPALGSRVAELRKTFGAGSPAPNRAPAYAKPPVPIKPPHLRIMSTPSLR